MTETTMTTQFTLEPRGPFSMEAARTLMCGFLRGARVCGAEDEVTVAFPLDGTFEATAVRVKADGATVRGDVFGTRAAEVAKKQVARALGLDVDATPFARGLERDPVLRAIARRRPGFRPPVAFSPYVMAGWSVLSQRLRMAQAADLQVRIAEAAGDVLEVGGTKVASFPS